MKHNLLYVNCPICGKSLIDLELGIEPRLHRYWCDDCFVDITLEENEDWRDDDDGL